MYANGVKMNYHYAIRRLRAWIQKHVLDHEPSRQPYHIANVEPNQTVQLYLMLISLYGYEDNFLSYLDADELFGIRKLHFKGVRMWYQTHIRIYKDGEIKGHYEIAPESNAQEHYAGTTLEYIQEKEQAELMDVVNLLNEPEPG